LGSLASPVQRLDCTFLLILPFIWLAGG